MNSTTLPWLNLALAYGLVLAFIVTAAYKKLGVSRDLFFASIQGSVQLILISFGITWLFKIEKPWMISIILILMCLLATQISFKRWRKYHNPKKMFSLLSISIFGTTFTTLFLLHLLGVMSWSGKFIIPIGGLLIGQVMSQCTLFLERVFSDVKKSIHLIESNLSLGASPTQSIQTIVHHALKTGTQPMIDMLRTLGLTYLPGMMAGMIVGGATPLDAAKYQLIIVFMIIFAFGLSSLILSLGIPHILFNKNEQLTQFN